MSPRTFAWLLFLIALAGLAIRVYVGSKTFLDFDEWQHIFMASVPRRADMAFELKTQAHPPLFFLLLRYFVPFASGNPAIYRIFSIASGTGSVIVIGLIGRKILDSAVVQLLCAAAFALSLDAIAISDEIRSYQLAIFFLLLAFLYWIEILQATERDARKAPFIAFAIYTSLALLSHYSAVFFLGACMAVSLLSRPIAMRRSPVLFASALSLPSAVFLFEYFVHAGAQPIQGYIAAFYRGGTPGEPAVPFVIRTSQAFFNLFSPVEVDRTPVFLLLLLPLGAAAAWTVRGQMKDGSAAARSSAAAIIFAGAIVLELLLASLLQKYPFGGLLRHQYIAGPFIFIAAFVVLDCLVAVAGPRLRRATAGLLLAASVGNVVAGGTGLIQYPGATVMQAEFALWQSAFPNARAVYLDHWGVLGYFVHTRNRPRRFVRRIPDGAAIDQYHIPAAEGQKTGNLDAVDIFYDKTRTVLDFSDSSVYRSFASCMRGSGAPELSLFFFFPAGIPNGQTPESMEELVRRKAADQGLTTLKTVVTSTVLFAGFKLTESR
jgi:uncharacterized membrane protein